MVEFNVIETDIVPLLLSFRKDRNEVALRFILACGKVEDNRSYIHTFNDSPLLSLSLLFSRIISTHDLASRKTY